MSHEHNIVDNGNAFIIDAVTRTISKPKDIPKVVQGDHNCERIRFELNALEIEGHDMSKSDRCEIHFTNFNPETDEKNEGVYVVDDLMQGDGKVAFSWRIEEDTTQLWGALGFSIKFLCFAEDGTKTFEWNSLSSGGIPVFPGKDNMKIVMEKYPDIIETLNKMVNACYDSVEKSAENVDKALYYGRNDVIPSPKEWFTFTLNADVTGYSVKANFDSADTEKTEIVLPYEYEGLPVVTVSESGFAGKENITSIVIPNTVTSVKAKAFQGCISLNKVVLPKNIKVLSDSLFEDCTSLVHINIPDTVKEIQCDVFRQAGIEYIDLPYGIEYIGEALFYKSSIRSVRIPNSVTEIRDSAFDGCINLEIVEIPDSVTLIGIRAFHGCLSLRSVVIGSGVTEIHKGAFLVCDCLKRVVMPSSVVNIAEDAIWHKDYNCNPDVILYVEQGSYAEEYAKQYGMKYVYSDIGKEAMSEKIAESLEDGGSVNEFLKNNQHDWNQNDETQIGHIKNRPFYTTDTITVLNIPNVTDVVGVKQPYENGGLQIGDRVVCMFDEYDESCLYDDRMFEITEFPKTITTGYGKYTLYSDGCTIESVTEYLEEGKPFQIVNPSHDVKVDPRYVPDMHYAVEWEEVINETFTITPDGYDEEWGGYCSDEKLLGLIAGNVYEVTANIYENSEVTASEVFTVTTREGAGNVNFYTNRTANFPITFECRDCVIYNLEHGSTGEIGANDPYEIFGAYCEIFSDEIEDNCPNFEKIEITVTGKGKHPVLKPLPKYILPEDMQNNYLQNDVTKADYIKNRPFYTDVEILAQQEIVTSGNPLACSVGFNEGTEVHDGDTISVEIYNNGLVAETKIEISSDSPYLYGEVMSVAFGPLTMDATELTCSAGRPSNVGAVAKFALDTSNGREMLGKTVQILNPSPNAGEVKSVSATICGVAPDDFMVYFDPASMPEEMPFDVNNVDSSKGESMLVTIDSKYGVNGFAINKITPNGVTVLADSDYSGATIKVSKEIVEKLDEKFIPDTIARTADLNAASAILANDVLTIKSTLLSATISNDVLIIKKQGV